MCFLVTDKVFTRLKPSIYDSSQGLGIISSIIKYGKFYMLVLGGIWMKRVPTTLCSFWWKTIKEEDRNMCDSSFLYKWFDFVGVIRNNHIPGSY
ncbi:hypothetical protein Lalb_Chr21g0306051 [Lupinus albus]|uniref:Uncharacterized protein n=1 Tax=Lupinus albus TaxID=3870 RepID=A0A6A4N460_LUPAL|nr:hypothetical protein Lalb_Chr21g0306051 [Lupinus albus]